MSVEENIELMRRWFHEVWNEGQTHKVHHFMASECVAKGQRGAESEIVGPEEFIKFIDEIRGSFSNMQLQIEDIFGAGDKVVVRWAATMTHTGDALGFKPSGKTVRLRGISIARIVDGKVVEGWDNWDQLGMLQQIGVLQEPESLPRSA